MREKKNIFLFLKPILSNSLALFFFLNFLSFWVLIFVSGRKMLHNHAFFKE